MFGMKCSERGTVLTMTLVFFMVFLVVTTAWLNFAIRQSHVVVDQEQEEQAFHISEAGVEYTLFLLNSGVYTVDDLLDLSSPIVQVVQDGLGNTMGTYELAFGDNGIAPLTVTALAYDAQLTGRCQQIVADIDLMSGVVSGSQYYVRSWDHVSGVTCDTENIVTMSPPTIVFSPSGWIPVIEGDSPPSTVNQVTFTIVLSHAYPLRVTVGFATSDFIIPWWSATSGDDYISKNETVTFNPGETMKTVTVDIVADNVQEGWWFWPYEYFYGVLSSPTNGSLGGADSRLVLIQDDD